jgi:hypothetical protein
MRLLEDLILFSDDGEGGSTCGHLPVGHRSYSPTVAPVRPLPELILKPGNGAAAGNLDELRHAGASLTTL